MARTKSSEKIKQRLGRIAENQQRKSEKPESPQTDPEPLQANDAEKPGTELDAKVTQLQQMLNDFLAREKEREEQMDGANALKGERTEVRRGRPPGSGRKTTVQSGPSRFKGLQPGQERATFVFNSEQLEQIRKIAYDRRVSLRELLAEIIGKYLDDANKE